MGSIASFDYPEHDIDTAVEIIETIHNKGISKQEILAEELGHSSSESGAFRNKLTSLRRYGLISGRGDITLSDLATRIVSPRPNSSERETAIGEAVRNVEILNKLFERLNFEEPNEDFWYQIVEVTDADRSEAKEKSGELRRLYEAGLPYVKQAQELGNEPEMEKPEAQLSGNPSQHEEGQIQGEINKGTDVPEGAEAILITPDARIDIRNRATYVAAKALFTDIGKKFDSNAETSSESESTGDPSDGDLEDFI